MLIIRLVIFVKKDSFRGLSTRIFSSFFLFQPPYISNFPFLTMLFMKIFGTNINKPYTITATQMRVLGMFFSLSENVCNQAANKPVPAFVL